MKQFYETYREDQIVAPLVRQLPWTHNLIISGAEQTARGAGIYLRMPVREQWKKRELERQFRVALFERTVLSPVKVAPAVRQMYPEAQSIFKDAYAIEFLGLPEGHSEADLHRELLIRMREFLLEWAATSVHCSSLSRLELRPASRRLRVDWAVQHAT